MDRLQHVSSLARIMGTGLRLVNNIPGMMYVEYGYVEGPTVDLLPLGVNPRYPTLQSRHLVVLHEIGHAACGHTQGRPPFSDEKWYFDNGVLKSEAEAWEFALDSLAEYGEELTESSKLFMWETCLGSYYRNAKMVGFNTPGQRLGNGDRAYVPFTYGEPDDYFWGVVGRFRPDVVEAANADSGDDDLEEYLIRP